MSKLYLVYAGWRNGMSSSPSVGKTVYETANPVTLVLKISVEALNWR